jgi:hypothetical protein
MKWRPSVLSLSFSFTLFFSESRTLPQAAATRSSIDESGTYKKRKEKAAILFPEARLSSYLLLFFYYGLASVKETRIKAAFYLWMHAKQPMAGPKD